VPAGNTGTNRAQPEHALSVDEGSDVLAASNKEAKDKDRVRRASTKKTRDKMQQGHVGETLRAVYQQTVDEQIPPEFLDILGKLA
jgi:hypothetical protein